MHSIEVQLRKVEKHRDDLGLLIPVPVDTPEQCFLGFSGLETLDLKRIQSRGSDQTGFFVKGPIDDPFSYTMHFDEREVQPALDLYERFDNRYTRASDELAQHARELARGAGEADEVVRRVIDYVASRFDYGSRNMSLEQPQLVCDVVRGNCIDINTMLMGMLYSVEMPCAYFAGYFFEAFTAPTTTGMHCWIATQGDGKPRYWDIAHFLKRDVREVVSGYNPVEGVRYAITRGRGLTYDIGQGIAIETSHVVQPRWIVADRQSVIASVEATLAGHWWEFDGATEARSMKSRWACKGPKTPSASTSADEAAREHQVTDSL